MAGAVDVGVVPGGGLVLDVGDRDGDPALLLLGGVVDRVEGPELGPALEGQGLGDRRGERGLAVVDVPDRADVHVRLGALELLLRHALVTPRDGAPAAAPYSTARPVCTRGQSPPRG